MANKAELRLTDQQRFDWLRLVRSENVGPRTFRALITQTVRKLPEFGVKQREERAVRESERWASSAA